MTIRDFRPSVLNFFIFLVRRGGLDPHEIALPTKTDVAQSDSRYCNVPSVSRGFTRSGYILKHHFPDLVVSKQKFWRADAIACVRMKRQEASQNVGSLPGRSCCADCRAERNCPAFYETEALRGGWSGQPEVVAAAKLPRCIFPPELIIIGEEEFGEFYRVGELFK